MTGLLAMMSVALVLLLGLAVAATRSLDTAVGRLRDTLRATADPAPRLGDRVADQ